MSRVRVYISPVSPTGGHTGFVDYTGDTDFTTLQKISQKLDNNEFDVGIFKNTNFNLKLRNDHGKFSDKNVAQSIFRSTREGSLVKVTWEQDENSPICGIAICGVDILTEEINVFYGILNDIASSQNIRDQKIRFSCQGLESVFSRVETNFSDLNQFDVFNAIIFDLLNQTEITSLMTVEASNISVSENQVPDSIAELEETTVKEALDKMLEMANAVVYVGVDDQTVYVKPRTPTAAVQYTFYGQASLQGSENIADITNVRTGLNRTFNFWKWTDTTITAKDASSIEEYGVRKKELDSELLTDTTRRTNILTNYKDEFKNPKQELTLTAILDYDTAGLFLLDRVNIDYPTVFESTIGGNLGRYGSAIYGTDTYPFGQWNLTIETSTNYKILGRSIDLRKGLITFNLREI